MDDTPSSSSLRPTASKGIMTREELLAKSQDWNLACDNALLLRLQEFSENLVKSSHEITANCDLLSNDITTLQFRLSNITNEFLMLGNTQFVENCVQEFEECNMVQQNDPPDFVPHTKAEKEAALIEKMKEAIQIGIKVQQQRSNALEESLIDSTSSRFSSSVNVAHLIGSSKFFSSKFCGLQNEARQNSIFSNSCASSSTSISSTIDDTLVSTTKIPPHETSEHAEILLRETSEQNTQQEERQPYVQNTNYHNVVDQISSSLGAATIHNSHTHDEDPEEITPPPAHKASKPKVESGNCPKPSYLIDTRIASQYFSVPNKPPSTPSPTSSSSSSLFEDNSVAYEGPALDTKSSSKPLPILDMSDDSDDDIFKALSKPNKDVNKFENSTPVVPPQAHSALNSPKKEVDKSEISTVQSKFKPTFNPDPFQKVIRNTVVEGQRNSSQPIEEKPKVVMQKEAVASPSSDEDIFNAFSKRKEDLNAFGNRSPVVPSKTQSVLSSPEGVGKSKISSVVQPKFKPTFNPDPFQKVIRNTEVEGHRNSSSQPIEEKPKVVMQKQASASTSTSSNEIIVRPNENEKVDVSKKRVQKSSSQIKSIFESSDSEDDTFSTKLSKNIKKDTPKHPSSTNVPHSKQKSASLFNDSDSDSDDLFSSISKIKKKVGTKDIFSGDALPTKSTSDAVKEDPRNSTGTTPLGKQKPTSLFNDSDSGNSDEDIFNSFSKRKEGSNSFENRSPVVPPKTEPVLNSPKKEVDKSKMSSNVSPKTQLIFNPDPFQKVIKSTSVEGQRNSNSEPIEEKPKVMQKEAVASPPSDEDVFKALSKPNEDLNTLPVAPPQAISVLNSPKKEVDKSEISHVQPKFKPTFNPDPFQKVIRNTSVEGQRNSSQPIEEKPKVVMQKEAVASPSSDEDIFNAFSKRKEDLNTFENRSPVVPSKTQSVLSSPEGVGKSKISSVVPPKSGPIFNPDPFQKVIRNTAVEGSSQPIEEKPKVVMQKKASASTSTSSNEIIVRPNEKEKIDVPKKRVQKSSSQIKSIFDSSDSEDDTFSTKLSKNIKKDTPKHPSSTNVPHTKQKSSSLFSDSDSDDLFSSASKVKKNVVTNDLFSGDSSTSDVFPTKSTPDTVKEDPQNSTSTKPLGKQKPMSLFNESDSDDDLFSSARKTTKTVKSVKTEEMISGASSGIAPDEQDTAEPSNNNNSSKKMSSNGMTGSGDGQNTKDKLFGAVAKSLENIFGAKGYNTLKPSSSSTITEAVSFDDEVFTKNLLICITKDRPKIKHRPPSLTRRHFSKSLGHLEMPNETEELDPFV